MSLYSNFSDEDLQGEIDELKTKIIALGKADDAGLSVIAGEGRRVEWARNVGKGLASMRNMKELLTQAEAELARRGCGAGGRALGVRF